MPQQAMIYPGAPGYKEVYTAEEAQAAQDGYYDSPDARQAMEHYRAYQEGAYSPSDPFEQVAFDLVSFLLKLDIPVRYRDELAYFTLLINKHQATTFLERPDLLLFDDLFWLVVNLYLIGDYKHGRIFAMNGLNLLNLFRSVNGQFMYYLITKREEYTHRYPDLFQKPLSFLEKWKLKRYVKAGAAQQQFGYGPRPGVR